MATATISTRLDSAILKKLEKLSTATKRSKSYLTAEAIEKYVDEQIWQVEAIKEGIKQADKGNFATEAEIKTLHKKWGIGGN